MTISTKKAYIFFLCIYLLCLPLGAINIGAFGSALKILSLLPILFAIMNIKYIKFPSPLIRYFFYVLIAACSILVSTSVSASVSKVISITQLFLLMATSCCFTYTEEDIATIKKSLIWSSRISAVLVLALGTYKEGRLWLTNGIINEDPNYFCMYLSFGAIATVQSLIYKVPFKKKIFGIVELSVYLIVVLLTGSRGGLLALMCGIFAYILFSGKKFSPKKIVMIAIVGIILYMGFGALSDTLQDRFTVDSVVESGGTGRTEIWLQGLDLFSNGTFFQKIFGYGIATTRFNFKSEGYAIDNVMHNMFLESLVEIGILGFIVYSIMVFSFLRKSYKNYDKFSFGVMTCMIVMSLSTSISSFKPYINIMIFILCTCMREKPIEVSCSEKNNSVLEREKYASYNSSSCIQR